MSWVVYRTDSGDIEKWYRLKSSASRAVSRRAKDLEKYSVFTVGPPLEYCSYRDYEGVLMGLRGEELKMWQFCQKRA